jgi:hypothetical protein
METKDEGPMGTSSAVVAKSAEIGIIEATDDNILCGGGGCKNPVKHIAGSESVYPSDRWKVCPHFCIECASWYHINCIPKSCIQGSRLNCPKCGKKVRLRLPSLYCKACGTNIEISSASSEVWTTATCSKCGRVNSLAILTDRLFGWELAWIFILGVLSLAAFITSWVYEASLLIKGTTGGLATVFALPWILLMVATIIKGTMPTSISLGPVGGFDAGIAGGVTLQTAREFKAKPVWYRFMRVYLWVLVNGLLAIVVIAAGGAIIYVFTELAKHR